MMQLAVEDRGEVTVVKVQETRLTYPVLSAFFARVRQLVEDGARALLIDLTPVSYIDSASIGCLMDVHRMLQEKGGALRLSGLQPRVETMISMTGVHKIIELHREEDEAIAAFSARRSRGKGNALRCASAPAHELELDGELLSVLEALYREVTLKRQLHVTFEDMMREIDGLVGQMSEADRRRYLVESLFLNSVTYENEMLDAYMRRLTASKKKGRGRAAGRSL